MNNYCTWIKVYLWTSNEYLFKISRLYLSFCRIVETSNWCSYHDNYCDNQWFHSTMQINCKRIMLAIFRISLSNKQPNANATRGNEQFISNKAQLKLAIYFVKMYPMKLSRSDIKWFSFGILLISLSQLFGTSILFLNSFSKYSIFSTQGVM